MGNAVGPVTLIAAGIYLGYLTLTGKAKAFVALLGGNTTPTPTPSGDSTLSTVTNPFGLLSPGGALGIATPQQQLINSQLPATIDPIAVAGGG
jgi:hypothetical protein